MYKLLRVKSNTVTKEVMKYLPQAFILSLQKIFFLCFITLLGLWSFILVDKLIISDGQP